ncbi:MAG: hypothetical protein F9K25_19340 [Candidatus Contendobacter sp.]|nr:MAG: hypothetical protein F9K25_19340 [Candidatus Contendobacter sp.]
MQPTRRLLLQWLPSLPLLGVLARLSRDAQGRLRVQAAGTDLSRPLDEAITITGVARWVIRRLWPGRVSS